MMKRPPIPRILEADMVEGLRAHPVNSFIWYIDREDLGNSVMIFANEAARRVDPLMENVGRRAIDAFPKVFESKENAFEYSKQSLESGTPKRLVEIVYGDDDRQQASTHYESKIFPLDEHHVLVQFDIIDDEQVINRNDRLVAALRSRNELLERSNAELERFAQIASHDLQEPLRTMATFVDMVTDEFADQLPSEAQDWLSRVADAANRQRAMIQSLLRYSSLGQSASPVEPVKLADIAREVTHDLSNAIERSSAKVEIGVLPEIQGYRAELRQLMHNLVANAIKFQAEGSIPHLRIAQVSAEETFSVEDNGIGIDPDMREEVFVPFRRLHNRRKYTGTGIGLAICQRIAELHGGSIHIEAPSDQGTRFSVRLSAELRKAA